MVELLIATHGNLGEGLVHSYNMIAGDSSNIHIVKLTEAGIDEFSKKLKDKLGTLIEKGSKVLVLCDIQGGTPYNESFMYSLEHPGSIEVVSGVNLPMLIEIGLLSQSTEDASMLADTAVTTGKSSISKLEETDDNNEEDGLGL